MSDTPKSPGEPPRLVPEDQQAFFSRADRFLAVANALLEDAKPGEVSAAMLFATARFNAFTAQNQGLPPGEVDEEAVAYFRDEYEKMLRENLGQILSSKAIDGG